MSCEEVLKVRSLTKRFNGVVAVNDLSLSLYKNDVLGFIGANGAGKTTTLRMLATVLKPDSGEVEVCGKPLSSLQEVRPFIGFMPDYFGVYDDLLVCEYLVFFTRAFHLSPHQTNFMIKEVLETVQMQDDIRRPILGLSRGMKQRLGLARIMLHNPQLLLLDEPAAGLDPRARLELREIIKQLQVQGKTIVISSHVLSDLSDFCNKVAIIDHGRLLVQEETQQLLDRMSEYRKMRLKVLHDPEKAEKILAENPLVSHVVWDGNELKFAFVGNDQDLSDFLKELFRREMPLVSFGEITNSLEDVYIKLTEN